MPINFSGINIYAKDAVKSYEFYKGLGFAVSELDEIPADGSPLGEWWSASFTLADGMNLWIWNGASKEIMPSNCNEIVIGCGGLDEMNKMYEEYKTAGYAVSTPEKQFYGGWEMHLTDLDGNKILFLD